MTRGRLIHSKDKRSQRATGARRGGGERGKETGAGKRPAPGLEDSGSGGGVRLLSISISQRMEKHNGTVECMFLL